MEEENKIEDLELDLDQEDSEVKVYEVGYLLVPTIAEENLGAEVTKLKDFLSDKGVSFISDEYPRLMELAYEMTSSVDHKRQKFSYGYFGWFKFECKPSCAKEINDELRNNDKIIRYLVVKTIKANTISTKKSYRQNSRKTSTPKEKEVINEESIDKEIEALVVDAE